MEISAVEISVMSRKRTLNNYCDNIIDTQFLSISTDNFLSHNLLMFCLNLEFVLENFKNWSI